jgi:hypothetical protein
MSLRVPHQPLDSDRYQNYDIQADAMTY